MMSRQKKGAKGKHENIFYSKLFWARSGEKLAIKFTRSANIYDFVFLSLQSMILLLLLRMQKWCFDVTDGEFFAGLKYFMLLPHFEADVATASHRSLKPPNFKTLTGSRFLPHRLTFPT